jgi:Zn-dependent peptidase ImmA (M78 family)
MDESSTQQAARAFLAPLDVSGIQNDLSPYAEAADAILRFEPLNEGECGFTVTKPGGRHVITVNELEREERQRFTVCHEIGHIVLKLPSRHEELPSWSFAKRDLNEIWCDVFAAELLMPYRQFRARMPPGEPDVTVIARLAGEFKTSYPAAASRYATLADLPCAFVTMQAGVVRYAARSTALRQARGWITPRTPIPRGSIAYRLRSAGESASESGAVPQDVWLENWDSAGDLCEVARHYSRFDTTLSLLWFLAEELPEVETDRFGHRVDDDGGLPELTGELPWPGKRRRK